MKKYAMFPIVGLLMLLLPALTLAGHGYHGHGYYGHGNMMKSWDMNALDTDNDKALTFEEYSENHRKQLRAGFDMIDADKDGVISVEEWKTFL